MAYVQVPQPGQLLKNEPEIVCSTLDSQWGLYFSKSVYADIYRCAQNDASKYSATCQSLTPVSCTFTASPTSILYGQSSTLSWSCTPTNTPRSCTIKDDASNTIGTGSQSGTKSVKPTRDTTYTLSCTGDPTVANSTASVSVGFLPVIREIIPR